MFSINRLIVFMVLIFCIYASMLPVFSSGAAWMNFDLIAHTDRAITTANEIRNGQLLAYFDFANPSYPGYSWNLFYPPLENFIYSGLYFFTANLNFSLKMLSFCIVIINLVQSYVAFRMLHMDKEKSLLLSVLYSFSIYQLDNLFIRGALPESLAMAFIPLFIICLISENNSIKITLVMAYSVSGLLLSNIPLFLCCGIVSLIYFILKPKKIKLIVTSYIFSILLSSFFFFPLIYSIHGQTFPIMATNWFQNMSEKSIGLYHLISGEKITSGKLSNMALGLGWPIFILFIYSIKDCQHKALMYTIGILTVLIISAANYTFLPEILYPLNKIQYTWRLIPFLIFFVLIIISYNKKIKSVHLLVSILTITLMSTWISVKAQSSFDITESNFRGPKNIVFSDYTLKNTKKLHSYENELLCSSLDGKRSENVRYLSRRGDYGLPYFSIYTENKMRCRLPVMAYSALSIEGKREITDGYLSYTTEPGMNVVKILYTPSFIYTLAFSFLLSLLSVIWYAILFYSNSDFKLSLKKNIF